MELSIYNFKSIKKLLNFEIKPFNIISGVNSSGKSSFIQLLLLIKQTIFLNSASIHLDIGGSFYQVLNFKDVLFNKQYKNKLKISLVFNKAEFSKISNREITLLLDSLDDYKCRIEIEFDFQDNEIYINEFSIYLPELQGKINYIKVLASRNQSSKFLIEANNEIFAKFDYLSPPPVLDVRYSSIYPVDFEYSVVSRTDDGFTETRRQFVVLKIDEFRSIVNTFFNNISYIGPLREPPKDEYSIERKHHSVGPKGEVTAQIFENYKDRDVSFYKLVPSEEGETFYITTTSLSAAVKYWMCDVFKVAKDIYPERHDSYYKILLVTENGVKTTIKHVGFGISQLLPIIVEGLIMPANSTLILEQPEIHLHPKFQSLLFDFLYNLTLQGKTVIVETHSDHLITRLRRRIAEDESGNMADKINLTFIETRKSENLFRKISLDDYGTFSFFPEDFIEQSDDELRAILEAQMRKRLREQKRDK